MTKHQPEHSEKEKSKQKPVEIESALGLESKPSATEQKKQDVQIKKKIIKKFPFNSKVANNLTHLEDDLKDWKPTSIASAKTTSVLTNDSGSKKKNQIVNMFLSSLPKPKQKAFDIEQINAINQNVSKKGHKQIFIKPTEQQLKWDAQDEFLTKNLKSFNKSQQKVQKNSYANAEEQKLSANEQKVEDQEQVMIEKIVWLNEDKKGKDANLADIVSKTWEKQANSLQEDDKDSEDSQKNKKKPSMGQNKFFPKFNK